MYKHIENRTKSRQFAVIRRRYSLLEVPRRGIHNAIAAAMSICVAVGNKVMDTHLPQPAGCGDKYDVESKGLKAPKYDICSVGRSMIEMLGVLAIIAVLSVGGIAGYSKAMSAYKLNKWTSQIREMIANTQTLYMNQKAYSYNATNLMNTLIATESIPKGMLDENNRDAYGNILNVSITSKKSVVAGERIKFQWLLPQTKSSIDCCAKLYELGQYYYNSLWLVAIEYDFTYTICGKMSPVAWLNDQKCQPYNFIKAKQHCKKCENQNCTMLFIMDDSAF